jgi:hypothetical protein
MKGLTHLAIGDSRFFTSLAGLKDLGALRYLSLYMCPQLESLTGVERAADLQHIEIDRCNRVTDLSPLAQVTRLRSVRIEMREPPTLGPLLKHPHIEYIWIVSAKRPAPQLIGELFESTPLRFVAAGRSCWIRDTAHWYHIPDTYAMTDRQQMVREHLLNEWHTVAAW